MKNILLIALLSSFMLSFSINKKGEFRPPGTVKIVDNFFFDTGELTNIDWKEYLSDLKIKHGEGSEIYKAALPDTLVWRSESSYNEPFVNTYFQHPSYDYYPVVGISHEQAKAYCIWRTKAVKIMMDANDINPVNFQYRLPTQTEWELVANAGYSDKQKKYLAKKRKRYKGKIKACNMLYIDDIPGEKIMITSPTRSLLPNKYEVYNIYGNVAEMVAEPGIAMGGSWQDKYEEIVPTNKPLHYDSPNRWVGFRCVAEVFE